MRKWEWVVCSWDREDRYKFGKNQKYKGTRKWIMRQANDVIIFWLLGITDVLDYCILSRTRKQTNK